MTIQEVEKKFREIKWDCDICPLVPCTSKNSMTLADCARDCAIYWDRNNIDITSAIERAIKR